MTAATQKEVLGFETEVKQLLKLMIHSLYSNREIFLRELVSNASDACDKLRFEALKDDALYEHDPELRIEIHFDADAKTLTIRDNGIGMSRQEVVDNIGTIARSGTRQFMEALSGDQAKDASLIGQFGVGFYSAFIVADRVTLTTRRAGAPATDGVRWESAGEGDYTLEAVEKAARGTEIILHLREDAAEFADAWRLKSLIRKYSDNIPFPVRLPKEGSPAEWEDANCATALWLRPKNELQQEDYDAFYKQTFHDFEPPLAHVHNKVEGKQEYTSLLFIPKRAPFDLWDRERRHGGVKLYVKRVFIMDDAEQLMPQYLRFVRGVIDSADLPLNVSREILQHSRDIEAIRNASVKRVLGLLEDMAANDADQFATFWEQFGKVLKEGAAEDFANKERIAGLLRFVSTAQEDDRETVSLKDYIGRMKEGQKAIYYITADNLKAARHSPHLEVFRKKGVEVLLLADRVDEWLVASLTEFDGKPLRSVAKGDLDLGDLETAAEKEAAKQLAEASDGIVKRVREALGDAVKEVRATGRLTDSPACLVVDEHDMGVHLERLLKAAGQSVAGTKPILEINPEHPLLQRLEAETDSARASDLARLLFDSALLAEGGQLEDPAGFVQRLNSLLLRLSA